MTVPPWRPDITDITAAGVFSLGNRTVNRMGYGAMQLAGPGVFGPPKDRQAALAVLREAVARGVNHIDTSDYYGPHVTNQQIHASQFLALLSAFSGRGIFALNNLLDPSARAARLMLHLG